MNLDSTSVSVNSSIPQKSIFSLEELCELTEVRPYVMRFWEAEFPEITPLQSSTGKKLYEYKDVELVMYIKKVLFEDKLTIERAKLLVKNYAENELLGLLEQKFENECDDVIESVEMPRASSSLFKNTIENKKEEFSFDHELMDDLKGKLNILQGKIVHLRTKIIQ